MRYGVVQWILSQSDRWKMTLYSDQRTTLASLPMSCVSKVTHILGHAILKRTCSQGQGALLL